MTEQNRRDFLKSISALGATAVVAPSILATACSQATKTSPQSSKTSPQNYEALIVSSDLYKTSEEQRFAFSIFEDSTTVASQGSVPVTLTSPSGKKQNFLEVPVREEGIKGKGIYSVNAKLDEEGIWEMHTTFKKQDLKLNAQVFPTSTSPALGSDTPTVATPTNANPLDATILCTRFEGECGFHKTSVPELLATKEPFVVLFATPARCKTSYCGPVLDLAMEVKKSETIPLVHIEIYQNKTSSDILDAVTGWGLASEPWMFGIDKNGKIASRLDGAFDQSEIRELFQGLN